MSIEQAPVANAPPMAPNTATAAFDIGSSSPWGTHVRNDNEGACHRHVRQLLDVVHYELVQLVDRRRLDTGDDIGLPIDRFRFLNELRKLVEQGIDKVTRAFRGHRNEYIGGNDRAADHGNLSERRLAENVLTVDHLCTDPQASLFRHCVK